VECESNGSRQLCGCQHGIIVSSTRLNLRSVSLVHVAACTLRRLSSLLYASHARVLVATQLAREVTLSHRDSQNELSTKLCVRVCELTLSKHARVHVASTTRHASAMPTLATMTHAHAHSAKHARALARRLVSHCQHHSRRGVHSLTERQRVVVVVVTKHTRDLQ
jgi:hypothetical protein